VNKNTRRLKMANRKSVRTGKKEVVSQNVRDNTQMIICHEVDANGKVVGSITRHIPITKERTSNFRKRPKNPKGTTFKND
jgi:ribosomal protein L34E